MDSREFASRFIDVLKLHPCLWNVNSSEYYNAEKKSEAISKLIEVALPYYKEADADFVSKKVLHLKTVVRREFRKVEESRASSGEVTYVPSLWYYERASFLAERMASRQSSEDEFEGPFPDPKGLRKFSYDEMMRFVELYRRQACLWNQRMDEYRSPQSRERAYREIRKQFGGLPLLSLDEVKAKIKGIRTTFNKELAKVIKSRENEDGEPYIPKLAWYRLADTFLRLRDEGENEVEITHPGGNSQQGSSVSVNLSPGISASRYLLPSSPGDIGLPRRFSYDETMRFLELYQQQQCLWDPQANNYKDPRARRKAHLAIAQKFGGDPPLSYLEVKNKIKGIRTIYSRELSKLMKSSGSGGEYKPTLAWFRKADSFLRGVRLKVRIWTTESVPSSDHVADYTQDESTIAAFDKSPSYSPEVLEISSASTSGYLEPFPESSAHGQGFNPATKEYKVEHFDMPIKENPRNHERRSEMDELNPVVTIRPITGNASNFKALESLQRSAAEPSLHPCFPVKLMQSNMMHNMEAAHVENDAWSYNEDVNEHEGNERPETLAEEVELESTHVSSDESDHKAKEDQRKSPKSEKRGGKRKKMRKKDKYYDSILKLLNRRLESSATSSPSSSGDGDRYDLAAKSWAASLRALGTEQQIYAERLINEVLFEARLGNLNRSVHLQQVPEPQAEHFIGGPQNIPPMNPSFNHHHQKSFPHR